MQGGGVQLSCFLSVQKGNSKISARNEHLMPSKNFAISLHFIHIHCV